MKLKKIIVIVLMIFPRILSASGGSDSENGNRYTYNIKDFSAIDGSAAFKIEVRRGDHFSVIVFADPSLKGKLIVEKRGNELHLGLKPILFSLQQSPKAVITMPDLQAVKLSGASSMIAAGFRSQEDFRCDLSGASSLELDLSSRSAELQLSGASKLKGVIETGDLEMNISGSSRIELTGTGETLQAELTGASKGEMQDYHVTEASVKLSGSSDLYIYLKGTLNIDASGASKLYYNGDVNLGNVELSGSSTMKKI